jgi:ubiquinone/menaquinone biosynthesis C-methylase UbiE
MNASATLSPAADAELPDYAPALRAFHEAFADELFAMLDCVGFRPGMRVLDVACGDGSYAAWIARRVGPEGHVAAVDLSPAWLQCARQTCTEFAQVELRRADARRLPFADDSFDVVWCAQSLYSLPDLNACLAEMVRVARPGATVAVLENDTLHHVLLPWPVELELQIRAAELTAFKQTSSQPARYYVGRWLSHLLRGAGLRRVRESAFATTRQPPLSAADRRFLQSHMDDLYARVAPLLTAATRRRLERLIAPNNPKAMMNQTGFVAVCIDRIVSGFFATS